MSSPRTSVQQLQQEFSQNKVTAGPQKLLLNTNMNSLESYLTGAIQKKRSNDNQTSSGNSKAGSTSTSSATSKKETSWNSLSTLIGEGKDRLIKFYGLQDRPDLVYLFGYSLALILILGLFYFLAKWDDRFGYLGTLHTKFKIVKSMGLQGLKNLKKPLNGDQLGKLFDDLKSSSQLNQQDIWNIKRLAVARQSHDMFFKLRPFDEDATKSLSYAVARVNTLVIFQIMAIILPWFLIGYAAWWLLKYLREWIQIVLAFVIQVQYKFIIDWIVAEVKNIVAAPVNAIVGLFDGGKKVINVTMPNYGDYFANWWENYVVKYLLIKVDNEYSCRINQTKKTLQNALDWTMIPAQQIYIWFFKLEQYGLIMPYQAFKKFVQQYFPKYAAALSKVGTSGEDIKKKFYSTLKRQTKQSIKSQKTSQKNISPRVNPKHTRDSGLRSFKNKVANQDVCRQTIL